MNKQEGLHILAERPVSARIMRISTPVDNEAICTLQNQARGFRFTDVGQIRTSLTRLGQDNLHEDEQDLDGELQWADNILDANTLDEVFSNNSSN
jgi:hypothetical protein